MSLATCCWETGTQEDPAHSSKHLLNESLGGLTLSRVLETPRRQVAWRVISKWPVRGVLPGAGSAHSKPRAGQTAYALLLPESPGTKTEALQGALKSV